MDDFSLWDQVRACLSCARKPDVDSDDDVEAQSFVRPELDRLLFDSEHDATDAEADALSLHSNFGISASSSSRKKNKKRRRGQGKTVKIFGYDLFGRPRMPDPSPPQSEDESSALVPPPQPRMPRSTSAPLDPDASPLPDAAIATLSSPHANAISNSNPGLAKWDAPLTDDQIALEEDLQREKEERKARRAARRLAKQQRAEAEADAAAGLAGDFDSPSARRDDAPEFEGFPGGNFTLARDAVRPNLAEEDGEFGPWMGASQPQRKESSVVDSQDQESEDDAVDAGGEYNRKSRTSADSGSGGGSSSRQSQSRSRRSHTSSLVDGSSYASRPRRSYHTRHESVASPQNVPLPPSSAGSSHGHELSSQLPQTQHKKRPAGQSRSSAARSHASSSTALSTPIRSPLGQDFFPQQAARVGVESHFGEELDVPAMGGEPQITLNLSADTGFPSTGFAGAGGKRSPLTNAQGAAFARSGW